MTIRFHPFDNPRHSPMAFDDVVSYRILIPLTRERLFTLEDSSILQALGMDPLWVMEYVLFLWFGFTKSSGHAYNFDDVYETICDDVASYILKWDDSPQDQKLQHLFAVNADHFVGMLRRMHGMFQQYLKDLPDQVPAEHFESLTLEREDPVEQYMVVALHIRKNP